jgi:hypothetical protein
MYVIDENLPDKYLAGSVNVNFRNAMSYIRQQYIILEKNEIKMG